MRDEAVLVTGGAGFLGSHLCGRLVREGYDVLCVDNFYTGTKRNIAGLLDAPNFELMRHDVTFPLYVEVDQIYNLACPASPVHYQYDPRPDDQNERARRDQHARSRQARESADLAGVHVGGLWRPGGASSEGRLLGSRQSDRHS